MPIGGRSAAIAQFRAAARGAFPGTDAQFEAAFPRLLVEWQQRQTLDALGDMDALIARKKASGLY